MLNIINNISGIFQTYRFISSTESYLVNQVEELQVDIDTFHPIG
ncbi:MAG TPA: hypothetical protein PLZ64_01490 [Chitinophagales bacterium]|nr:hypothetical protein [Chitinophagales bacterium]